MKRVLVTSLAVTAFACAGFAQALKGPDTVSAIVQVERLSGDQHFGFKHTCLVVFGDGRYHRESTQQILEYDTRAGQWNASRVFEGSLVSDDIQKLRQIVESQDFRSLTGAMGDADLLPSQLGNRRGYVVPHAEINILDASVLHPGWAQVFAVVGVRTDLRATHSLKSFVRWVEEIDKHPGRSLDSSQANGCDTSSQATSSWNTTSELVPRPISRPSSTPAVSAVPPETVLVFAIVNVDGRLTQLSVNKEISDANRRAVLEKTNLLRFAPARLHGMPIPWPIQVNIVP